jgi:hypothetical protein
MKYRRYKLSRPSPTGPQDSAKGRKAVWFWLTADFVLDHTLGLPQGEGADSAPSPTPKAEWGRVAVRVKAPGEESRICFIPAFFVVN